MIGLFILSCLVYFITCAPSDYSLTWNHISPHKLSAHFEHKTGQSLIFESSPHSLHMINHEGKHILSYNTEIDLSKIIMGNYYPPNATKGTMENFNAYLNSEARFLPDLYHAMAALHISGREMPAAMGVYRMALGFEKYRTKFVDANQPPQCSTCKKNDYSSCRVAPQCCDCIGLCGAGSSCWSFVCGDCCWWPGCCGHDMCCYDFWSFGCLTPITLECLLVYSCSSPDTTRCCNSTPTGPNSCLVDKYCGCSLC